MKKRYTEEQIASARVGDGGLGDRSEAWDFRAVVLPLEKKYAGLGVAELHRLKQLEESNSKQLVADLSLDKKMLQDVLSKRL